MNRHILLAYGEKELTKRLKSVLEQQGHIATILWEGDPPRARYDQIIQLARDPAHLAEGTRLLLGKAEKDRSRLILLIYRLDEKLYEEAARFAQTLVEDAARRNEAETVILNLGRIYGPDIPSRDSGALGHLVTEFSEGNVLTLYGEGKDRDYYLFTADALEGIALAVEKANPGETYALAPSVSINSEAAAKLLYELGGGRHEISSHRGLSAIAEKGEVPGKPLPEFKIKTPFHEGILTILKSAPPAPRARPEIRLPHLRLPLIHFPKIGGWLRRPPSSRALRVAAIALIVLSPILYLGGEAGLIALQLNQTKSALVELNFTRAQSAAAGAAGNLARIGKVFPAARSLEETARAVVDIASQGEVITTALENLAKSRRGEPTNPQSAEDFRALSAALSSAEDRLAIAWLESQSLNSEWLKAPAEKLRTALEEGLRVIRLGRAFAQDAEDLLGYRGERNYLILFQNSAEIWPGGGFVGSLAQFTLKDGGIEELKFYDVYDFSQYKNAGGVEGTYISLDPDFSENAKNFAGVFKQATGVTVDGTIGIDLHLAQELLTITGPLYLADFEKEITSENFFEITTAEVEKDFFPGSTKKKRFIQALNEAVLDKFLNLKRDEYSTLARLFWKELNRKGVLLHFANPILHQMVIAADFAGIIEDTSGDYLLALDHNAGTKGTVWVKRSISYRVFNTNREGTLQAELKITWKNEGTEAWPGGNYLNKTAVLAPLGTRLVEARRGEEDVTNRFLTGTLGGKTQFYLPYDVSAYIEVAPQSEQTLTLIYDLPEGLDIRNGYTLLVQKQSGTVADAFRLEFEEPFGYEARSADLQRIDNKLVFEGNLSTDLNFEIEIKER